MMRLLKSVALATVVAAPPAAVLPAAAQQPAEQAIPAKVRLFIPFKDYSPEENQRVLALYKWLRVADVSDGMDVVGLQDVGDRVARRPRVVEGHADLHPPCRRHRRDPALRADQPARAADGRSDDRPLVQHGHVGGVVVVPRERAEDVAREALTFLDNITRDRYIKETGQNPWAERRR